MFDNKIIDIFDTEPSVDTVWEGKFKIPWDAPEFSRRMLREHLTQDHDLASRKTESIRTQVQWITERLLGGDGSRILDLGCGPGLYAHELAKGGHRYRGIDFGPASVEYAQQHHAADGRCEFVLGDVRDADFGQGHDLAMMVYGELNVFPPESCAQILARAFAALNSEGRILLEVHTYDAVRAAGQGTSWYKAESGLFSDSPHLCLIENHWLEEIAVSQQFFHVIDLETASLQSYRSTMQAYTNKRYERLLLEAGFSSVTMHPDWPGATDALVAISASR